VRIFGSGATGNLVQGNFIGTNVSGAINMGNGQSGISIQSPAGSTTIGGSAAGARNVISGNLSNGVFVSGTNNLVAGNYIGTDTTGNNKIGNSNFGVIINGPASNNTVGGTVTGAGNLISGNGGGIEIAGDSTNIATANVIAGNYIGVKAGGTAALGNISDGVVIASAGNNTIGGNAGTSFQGPCTGACNVISGNGGNGVQLSGNLASGNLVQGNYIGTDVTGTAAIGNGLDGFLSVFGANHNVVGNPLDNNSTAITSAEAASNISGLSATMAVTYNKCMQEGNKIFKWNSTTGEFLFITCNADGTQTTEQGQGEVDNKQTFLYIINGRDLTGNPFKAEINGYLDQGRLLKLSPFDGVTKLITDLGPSKSKCDCGRPQLLAGNAGRGTHLDTSDNNIVRRNTIGYAVNGAALPNSSSAISTAQSFNNHSDDNDITCTSGVPCVDHQSGIGDTFQGNTYQTQGASVSFSSGANNNQVAPVISGCTQTSTAQIECTAEVACSPNVDCSFEWFRAHSPDPDPFFLQTRPESRQSISIPSNGHATATATFDPGPDFNFITDKIVATTTDPTNGTSAFSTSVPVTPSSVSTDLALTMTGSPNPATNSNITYTIGVANNGPAAAPNTVIIDILPLATNFVSATSSAGNCSVDIHNVITCNLGSLANGASATATFVAAPTTTGVFLNFAGVSSNITDNKRTNNGVFVETVVNAPSASPTPPPTPSPTGTPTSTATPTPASTPTPTATPGLIGNVSTRLPIGTDDNVLIEGFIVQGPAGSSKKIIVRAIGPSLVPFGIADAVANPTLEIFDGSSVKIAANNDWKITQVGGIITGDQFSEIAASGLAPGNELESAIIANLAPGSYTAVVRGLGNTTGTGVVDAYDVSAGSSAKLANIATRGLIQPGDKLMIAGFIIQNAPVRAVVRAIGPSLIAFGINNALADTTLQLRDQNGVIVVENDDWKVRSDGSSQQAELEATSLQPTNDLEAAFVATLQPGQYTAQVRGKPETTGTGVVQVYFLQ
jgi:uncharacterized repeat protein (TIGR01451 family)